ncbi:MAG: hypothetical protein FK733_14540 [Asgard group archaeon]|nr:hypothetical protein [Asgard group archaeon]
MRIKLQFAIIFSCLLFVLLPITNTHSATVWYQCDPLDDVLYYEADVEQNKGDYHDEIDIRSVELNGSNLIVKTQEPPIEDQNHNYSIVVIWQELTVPEVRSNYTSVDLFNGTRLVFSQIYYGEDFVTKDVNDSITIEENSIICPIPLFTSISDKTAIKVDGGAYFYVNISNGKYFFDDLSGSITKKSPGFIFSTTMICIVCVAAICLIRKKKR